MLSLLGSVLGFGTSVLPEVLNFFKQKQANSHEIKLLESKAKHAEVLSRLKLDELDAKADIEETKGLYAHDTALAQNGGWVVGLQASVRPMITYAFMVAFLGVKGTMIYALIFNQDVDWASALQMAWDPETQAVWSAIISFWFGSRAMQKFRPRQPK